MQGHSCMQSLCQATQAISHVLYQGGERKGLRRATDSKRERDKKRKRSWKHCGPPSNPSGRRSTDSLCQRSLTKPTPISVESLKVPWGKKEVLAKNIEEGKKERKKKSAADYSRCLVGAKVPVKTRVSPHQRF